MCKDPETTRLSLIKKQSNHQKKSNGTVITWSGNNNPLYQRKNTSIVTKYSKISKQYNINPNTVIKWRNRNHVNDKPSGPKNPRSKVLTLLQEATIEAFRNHTLLPLDD